MREAAGTAVAAPTFPHPVLARVFPTARLDAAARGKLTVVVAPFGWGKSVLLSEWAAQRRDRVAFLSFTRGDDARSLPSLLAAAVSQLTGRPPRNPPADVVDEAMLQLLEAEMTSLAESYLVFDDVDVLDQTCQDMLAAFIACTTPQVHTIASSRSSEVFSDLVDDLRMRDEVAYVRAIDLAFDRDDARLLLQGISGRIVPDAAVESLLATTEGWAAALWCAAVSMRDTRADLSIFAAQFGADDPQLAALLRRELHASLSPDVRRFLLQTSVLEWLTAPLCDAITERDDAHEMLQLLERASLVRRDGLRVRYHPLWRDVLTRELREAEPAAEARLLRAAAEWHMSRQQFHEAARCFIAAEEWDALLSLITTQAKLMFEQRRVETLIAWLEAVPLERRLVNHRTMLEYAEVLTVVGRTHAAEELARQLGPPELLPLAERAAVDAMTTTWVQWHLPPQKAIDAANDFELIVDKLVPTAILATATTPSSLRTVARVGRARARWYLGDISSARAELDAEMRGGDTYPPWQLNAVGAFALLEAWSGRLTVAEQHARHALREAADVGLSEHPAIIDATLAMAHVFRERHLLDRAEAMLADAHDIATDVHKTMSLAIHAVEYAHLQLSLSQPKLGLAGLERFRASGHGVLPPFIAARHRATEALLLLALGDASSAEHVLEYRATDATPEVAAVAMQLALARASRSSAHHILAKWPNGDELQSDLMYKLWSAVVMYSEGGHDEALAGMDAVVRVAEPIGHVGLFVDSGVDAVHVLRALFRAQPTPYLRAIVRPDRPVPLRSVVVAGNSGMLTDRELAVLRYLPSRLTNAEMAKELFLSNNTIKSHLRSIYSKLGVSGRAEAIERAEDLGLV